MVTMNYSSGFLGHKGMKRGAIFNLLFSSFPKEWTVLVWYTYAEEVVVVVQQEKKTPLQTFIALQKSLGLMELETSTYKTIAKKRVIILS